MGKLKWFLIFGGVAVVGWLLLRRASYPASVGPDGQPIPEAVPGKPINIGPISFGGSQQAADRATSTTPAKTVPGPIKLGTNATVPEITLQTVSVKDLTLGRLGVTSPGRFKL